jgi:hypothetical protein
MPFVSRKQSAACYASHGFNGKVDCGEWSRKTDYKHLPERKKKSFKEWLEEHHPEIKTIHASTETI